MPEVDFGLKMISDSVGFYHFACFVLFIRAYTNMHLQLVQFHMQKNRMDSIATDREGGLCEGTTTRASCTH